MQEIEEQEDSEEEKGYDNDQMEIVEVEEVPESRGLVDGSESDPQEVD